ncbi:acyltransferase family protein, partial [Vibrio cyclitrophicus]
MFFSLNNEAKLSNLSSGRDNNFNLVRLIASLLVLFTHAYALFFGVSSAEPFYEFGFTLGSIAVDVFFVSSGFLIYKSLESSDGLKKFFWFRALRIYPGLIFSLFLTVLCLSAFSTLSLLDYLFNIDTWFYLLKNSFLFFGIEYELPGVFHHVPYSNVINGSLWTLPYEVTMYVAISIFYVMDKSGSSKRGLLLISVWLFISIFLFSGVAEFYGLKTLFRLAFFFFFGASFYAFRNIVYFNSKVFFCFLILILLSCFYLKHLSYLYYLLMPYCLLWFIYIPDLFRKKINNFGDISYGVYIYAFPIQQALISSFPEFYFSLYVFFSFFVV